MASKLQKLQNPLSIAFPCPANLVANEPVRIAGDLTVAKLTSAGHRDILGNVIRFLEGATCTVETSFRERRTREAYSELPVGPFVWGEASKPVAWTPGGFASVTGSVSGPFAITAEANAISVTVGSEDPVVLPLTIGAARTATQIAGEINAAISDITATLSGQKIVLTCDRLLTDFTINTVDADCYALLGLEVGSVENTDPSHSPAAIGGYVICGPDPLTLTSVLPDLYEITLNTNDTLKLKIGGGEEQSFAITAGEAITATAVVNILNATGVGFVASVYNNRVKITCNSAWDDIEITTSNAAATLGFTVGVVTASKTVQTLEY
jgi:hypothetical protein